MAAETIGNKIRVLLVDDQNIIRLGLASILSGKPNLEIIGEAVDGADALVKTREMHPDVIILDLVMPRMDGLSAIPLLLKEQPGLKIIVLTSHEDEKIILAAVKAGAVGFLSKDTDLDNLLFTLEAANRGIVSFPQAIVQKWALGVNAPADASHLVSLTERERKVLELVCQGQSNQEIANHLSVGLSTVRTHVSSILRKMDVPSRSKAILVAFESKLVPMNLPDGQADLEL
jgi:two-component system, NarL family, response regulator LiaR